MIDKEKDFIDWIIASKEGELLIPFEDLDLELTPYVESDKLNDERLRLISEKQQVLVGWCKEIDSLNWSVGFVDDENQNVMVVKWWFNEQDYLLRNTRNNL